MAIADEIEDKLSEVYGDSVEYHPYTFTKSYQMFFCLKISIDYDKLVLLDIELKTIADETSLEYLSKEAEKVKGKDVVKRILVYKGITDTITINNRDVLCVNYKDFLQDVKKYVEE